VRRLAERVLARRGWHVLTAESGEAAVALLGELRNRGAAPALSVLVSDVVMPGMDGPALVRALREDYPGVPAILVSGYTQDTLRGELECHGVSFLPKPYALKGLVAEVARVMGSRTGAEKGAGSPGESPGESPGGPREATLENIYRTLS
jgi:two-component system cell cycle sensor histidine kinase/response regulator CckA